MDGPPSYRFATQVPSGCLFGLHAPRLSRPCSLGRWRGSSRSSARHSFCVLQPASAWTNSGAENSIWSRCSRAATYGSVRRWRGGGGGGAGTVVNQAARSGGRWQHGAGVPMSVWTGSDLGQAVWRLLTSRTRRGGLPVRCIDRTRFGAVIFRRRDGAAGLTSRRGIEGGPGGGVVSVSRKLQQCMPSVAARGAAHVALRWPCHRRHGHLHRPVLARCSPVGAGGIPWTVFPPCLYPRRQWSKRTEVLVQTSLRSPSLTRCWEKHPGVRSGLRWPGPPIAPPSGWT